MGTFYNTYKSYLTERFGEPVLKIPLNSKFTCPNRDGSRGVGGCTFCDNRSFSPVALDRRTPVQQLEEGIKRNSRNYNKFIGYLQTYSNTYASVDYLKSIYEPLIECDKVVGLNIGTRPDCLPDDVLDYIEELSKRTYISVEVGLQTGSNKTLKAINRGHTYEEFEDAIYRLAERNIEAVTHLMVGFPTDTREDLLNTAHNIANLPIHGVKIHQLMIIQYTEYEKMYERGEIKLLSIEEYCELLGEMVARLHPDQYMHRIMADSKPEDGLIAPMWSTSENKNKHKVMSTIQKYMEARDIYQGKLYQPKNVAVS